MWHLVYGFVIYHFRSRMNSELNDVTSLLQSFGKTPQPTMKASLNAKVFVD